MIRNTKSMQLTLIRSVYTLLFAIALPLLSLAQRKTDAIQTFESEVMQSFSKSYDASVKLFAYNERTGNKRFTGSGVVVNPEGLILTVAHIPGDDFYVRFPNGSEARAKSLGRISSLDAAMMQIVDEGPFPYAPVGRSADLQPGQPCISLGYAGSLRSDIPALRLGFVVRTPEMVQSSDTTQRRRGGNRFRNRLQTTCLMEPGDSGGPVFDLEGRVIALHSAINGPLDVNLEVPVDLYLTYWDALLSGEQFTGAPDSLAVSVPALAPSTIQHAYIPFSDTTTVLKQAFGQLKLPAFSILSQVGDSSVSIQGTLVDMGAYLPSGSLRGKSFLLSKSSLVGKSPEVNAGKKRNVKANVLFRDELRDLVLLEIPRQRGAHAFVLDEAPDSVAHALVGTFVHTPLPNGNARMAVLGSIPFGIEGQSRAGYFGAALEARDEGVVFSMVQDNSPAKRAELAVGMQVLRMNNEAISTPESFVQLVQSRRPGDTIRVEYLLEAEMQVKDVVLASRPLVSGTHIAERFEGGKSVVRDGFSRVFAHDGRLRPEECGSPLVDLQGRLYGINIARLSRTCTLALPVDEVRLFMKAAVSDLR